MVWTAPRTWVDREVVSASTMNTDFRDNYVLASPGLFTAKGDLIVATGANATVRLAIGTDSQILVGDAATSSGWKWTNNTSAPSGMIAMFTSSCPAGWSVYTNAQGRALVGVPSGGSIATVGTALTDLENKTHSHTTTGSHTHTMTVQVADNGGANWGSNTANISTASFPTTDTVSLSDQFAYIQLQICEKD